jgi:hypothetical protein
MVRWEERGDEIKEVRNEIKQRRVGIAAQTTRREPQMAQFLKFGATESALLTADGGNSSQGTFRILETPAIFMGNICLSFFGV